MSELINGWWVIRFRHYIQFVISRAAIDSNVAATARLEMTKQPNGVRIYVQKLKQNDDNDVVDDERHYINLGAHMSAAHDGMSASFTTHFLYGLFLGCTFCRL